MISTRSLSTCGKLDNLRRRTGGAQLASVGQPSALNEISKLRSVFTTDARSRFGAEVQVTDASSSGIQVASVDATCTKDAIRLRN